MGHKVVRGVVAGGMRRLGLALFADDARKLFRRITVRVPRNRSALARAFAGANVLSIRMAANQGEFGDVEILSLKLDAFGGRIWNMLNAIRVADSLGAQMKFAWPLRPLDGIRPAEETFSSAFLEEHYIPKVDVTQYRNVRIWSQTDVLRLRGTSERVWYELMHKDRRFDKLDVASDEFRFPGLPSFLAAFERIEFRPDLEEVRSRAAAESTFGLAIHVRRGDVASGDFRFGGHFADKAIPFPYIEALIDQAFPKRVLLVGNELAGLSRRGLTKRPNVVVATDLIPVPEDDDLAAIMRDFTLLTRCERIVAGNSMFAMLPARIAKAKLVNPTEVLTRSRQRELLKGATVRGKLWLDVETAIVCTYLLVFFRDSLASDELDELQFLLYKCDPDNPSVVLAAAAAHLKHGRHNHAAEVLMEAKSRGVPASCLRLLENTFGRVAGVGFTAITGRLLRDEDWSLLRANCTSLPEAAFYVGIKDASEGQWSAARVTLKMALNTSQGSQVQQAIDFVESMESKSAFGSRFGFSTDPGPDEGLLDPTLYNFRTGMSQELATEY